MVSTIFIALMRVLIAIVPMAIWLTLPWEASSQTGGNNIDRTDEQQLVHHSWRARRAARLRHSHTTTAYHSRRTAK